MRDIIIAALALVVGVVLGGLGPKADLRAVEAELTALKEKPCESAMDAGDVTALFGKRMASAREKSARVRPGKETPAPGTPARAEAAATPAKAADEPPKVRALGQALAEDAEKIGAAKQALALRKAQSRQAFIESARLDEEQTKDLDETLAKMNDGLRDIAENVADILEQGQEPTRHEMMVFAAEALDVFIETDNRLGEMLTDEQFENVNADALDPVNHIDPALLDLFQGLAP